MRNADRLDWGKLGRRWIGRQATNPANLDWQRVAFAAWQRLGFDGVATFARGELAEVAAEVDPATGEVAPLTNARRAVRLAVAHGWIEPGSTTRRVVVHGGTFAVGRQ